MSLTSYKYENLEIGYENWIFWNILQGDWTLSLHELLF